MSRTPAATRNPQSICGCRPAGKSRGSAKAATQSGAHPSPTESVSEIGTTDPGVSRSPVPRGDRADISFLLPRRGKGCLGGGRMARGATAGGAGERPKCLNTRRSTGPKSAVMTTQSPIRNRYGILAAVDRRPVLQRRWRWAPAVAPLLGAVLLWAQKDIDVRAHLERAEQALQRSDPETARKELQEAVRLNPSSAEAHARLGMVYRKLGMPAQAAESLEQAVRLEPDPRVKVLLAFSYKEAGRHRDAIPLLEASFESEQKDSLRSVVGQHLVEFHMAVGAPEQALAVVQKLRQIAPDDPGVLYLSSKVYLTLWNGAFQRMMAKSPDSYQVHL